MPSSSTGPQAAWDVGSDYSTDGRMWLTGIPTSEDDHHADNRVTWEIKENETQKSGILQQFPGSVVFILPKDPAHHVRITGLIESEVAFSLNLYRLKQKKYDPVYLDRTTAKGTPILPGIDFKDKEFNWADII